MAARRQEVHGMGLATSIAKCAEVLDRVEVDEHAVFFLDVAQRVEVETKPVRELDRAQRDQARAPVDERFDSRSRRCGRRRASTETRTSTPRSFKLSHGYTFDGYSMSAMMMLSPSLHGETVGDDADALSRVGDPRDLGRGRGPDEPSGVLIWRSSSRENRHHSG